MTSPFVFFRFQSCTDSKHQSEAGDDVDGEAQEGPKNRSVRRRGKCGKYDLCAETISQFANVSDSSSSKSLLKDDDERI